MMTYDYSTGRIERDFSFVKFGIICRLSGLPSRVGKPGCQRCPYNGGIVEGFDDKEISFVKCKHKEAEDSEENTWTKWHYLDEFKNEALCAFCN